MKTKIIAVLTSFCLVFTAPALAAASEMSSGIGSKAAAMFEVSDPRSIEAAELSEKEMRETEGEVLPLVAGALMAGAASAWTYHGMHYRKHGTLGDSKGALIETGIGIGMYFAGGGWIGTAAKLGKAGRTANLIRNTGQSQVASLANPY